MSANDLGFMETAAQQDERNALLAAEMHLLRAMFWIERAKDLTPDAKALALKRANLAYVLISETIFKQQSV